jgi:hypothetical protein
VQGYRIDATVGTQGGDGKVKATSADSTADYLSSKITVDNSLTKGIETINGYQKVSLASVGLVRTNSSDQYTGYLAGKVQAGNGITITEVNPGGGTWKLEIASTGTGPGALQGLETYSPQLADGSLTLNTTAYGYWSDLIIPQGDITVNSIGMYILQVGTPTNFRLGIYTLGVSVDTLVAQTANQTSISSTGWRYYALTAPYTLTAGTPYLLALQGKFNATQIAKRTVSLTPNLGIHFARVDNQNAANPSGGMMTTCGYSSSNICTWFAAK